MINKKIIYFDRNVMEAIRKRSDEQVYEKYESLKTASIFPYSPAHMEELFVGYRENADEDSANAIWEEEMRFVSELTDHYELLSTGGEIALEFEHPLLCMKRVTDAYEDTLLAEARDACFHAYRSKEAFKEYFFNLNHLISIEKLLEIMTNKSKVNYIAIINNMVKEYEINYVISRNDITIVIDETKSIIYNGTIIKAPKVFTKLQEKYAMNDTHKKTLGNTPSSEILKNEKIMAFIQNELNIDLSLKYKDIKCNHSLLEQHFESLFKALAMVGYKTEGNNKSRSAMHDTTHAIYGTKADFFVTADKPFRQKLEAIYSHLGVPTKVLSIEEFLQHNFE